MSERESAPQGLEEKLERIVSSPGKARRALRHLINVRGFQAIEHDRDGPTLVSVWGMGGNTFWRRVAGRRDTAVFEQVEP